MILCVENVNWVLEGAISDCQKVFSQDKISSQGSCWLMLREGIGNSERNKRYQEVFITQSIHLKRRSISTTPNGKASISTSKTHNNSKLWEAGNRVSLTMLFQRNGRNPMQQLVDAKPEFSDSSATDKQRAVWNWELPKYTVFRSRNRTGIEFNEILQVYPSGYFSHKEVSKSIRRKILPESRSCFRGFNYLKSNFRQDAETCIADARSEESV